MQAIEPTRQAMEPTWPIVDATCRIFEPTRQAMEPIRQIVDSAVTARRSTRPGLKASCPMGRAAFPPRRKIGPALRITAPFLRRAELLADGAAAALRSALHALCIVSRIRDPIGRVLNPICRVL